MPKQMNIINQLQTYSYSISAGTTEQTFSLKSMCYPVVELLFIVRLNDSQNANNYFNYSNTLNTVNRANPINTVRLIFDGRDRIKTIDASNFTHLEPSKVHTNTPVNKFIHVYSFALNPEGVQPSGTCNFSKLDNVSLNLVCNNSIQDGLLTVYAISYNILKIQSGMAGLMFSS